MISNINYFDEKYKITDLDAVMQLKEFSTLLNNISFKSRQDKNTSHLLTIME